MPMDAVAANPDICVGLSCRERFMNIAAKIADLVRSEPLANGPQTLPQLTPEMYANLRRLAHSVMRRERGGHTLQPTEVLNEAFKCLLKSEIAVHDAVHFFRLAAGAMRHVLTDYAKQRNAKKREAVTHEQDVVIYDNQACPLDVLDIDRALVALKAQLPRAAEFLELRYFAGLDDVEIEAVYQVSNATVLRECRLGKAFIMKYLSQTSKTPESEESQAVP